MTTALGEVEAIFRYPVKSMAGVRMDDATLGWRGIDGDRRLALRRRGDQSGCPWLTASKMPDLVLFRPVDHDSLPTLIKTPDGSELPVFGEELAATIARRHGALVEMMHLRDGIFDEGTVSVIASDTVRAISTEARLHPDARRFRPNIVLRLLQPQAFQEDRWLGRVLVFGDHPDAPRVSVISRDVRCSMVNIDPDSARTDPNVMKSVARMNQNTAGVYGTVVHVGRVAIGQTVRLALQ